MDHLITAADEELIPPEMLSKGRNLVNTAVKLINGYMNYLKRAATKSGVSESLAEYVIPDQNDKEIFRPTTDNK